MGNILGAYLLPHPPIILEEIGKGEEKKAQSTINGMKIASRDIKKKSPSNIIIITPHGPLFRDAISISVEENLIGDFARFGHGEISFKFKNNLALTKKIVGNSMKSNISIVEVDDENSKKYNIENSLDHGALVPLYFVDKEYKDFKLIHITYGLLTPEKLFKFGSVIEESIKSLDDDVVIIASGDLSHKLSNEGPYNYSPDGKVFDEKIINIIKEGKLGDLKLFDLDLAENAGECGLRSLMIMAGAIEDYRLEPEVMSYEGPFGVGYSTAKIEVYEDKYESEYVKLARKSLEYYIKNGEYLPIPDGTLEMKKGVFVTLKKNNMLRGCIGTIQPSRESIEIEIMQNAVSAGTQDPRFQSVKESELDELIYSVDILGEPEPISSLEELDLDKYGVIVFSGARKGLLLPNLEGISSVEEQVSIALNKANISPDEKYKMERFEVKRYH